MSHFEVLRYLAAVSAAIWFVLAAFQAYRDRVRTWTEKFFFFACLFAGLYAFSDFLFFRTDSPGDAALAAKMSLTSVTITTLFLLLFTLVYVGRMRRAYWLLALVSGALVLVEWTLMLVEVRRPVPDELFLPVFNPLAFLALLVYVLVYGSLGIWNLYRVYGIVRVQSPRLARRAAGLVLTFALVLVLGLGTNGYLGVIQNTTFPPPFSTLLLIVAGVVLYTLYPGGRERISEAIRKFRARRYDIMQVFLIYTDGTLIGSYAKELADGVDRDLFSATLDVIQNFMRTSFPFLSGTSLRTIEHGNLKIIVERGKQCYLTVVLEGEENDLLRRQMRDEVLAFESANDQILRHWRGVPSEAVGADQVFQRILRPVELFGA